MPAISAMCVRQKTRNTGTMMTIDSLIPRRFSTMRMPTRITSSGSLKTWMWGGTTLKIWSTAEAIDVVMVRT